MTYSFLIKEISLLLFTTLAKILEYQFIKTENHS